MSGVVDRTIPVQKEVSFGEGRSDSQRSRRLVDLDAAEPGAVLIADVDAHERDGTGLEPPAGAGGLAPGQASGHSRGMSDWKSILSGRFIVFDGPDGSGKSTQLRRFAEHCEAQDVTPELVREPGGTPIGEAIRGVLLDPRYAEMELRCEMLLYMASRSQLMTERIRPALDAGRFVLADRFISSTLAYQGTAGGLDPEEILAVGRVATGGCWPDLVVIFDVDEETAASRLPADLDRMELKGAEFHRRVRQGYLAQAERDPKRHLVIDATRSEDEVFASLVEGVAERLGGVRLSSGESRVGNGNASVG
jgi:dTMP kinase